MSLNAVGSLLPSLVLFVWVREYDRRVCSACLLLTAHQNWLGSTLVGILLYCIYSVLVDYCTFKPDVTQLRHRLNILYTGCTLVWILVEHWFYTGLDTD